MPEDLSADPRVHVLGRPLSLSPELRLAGLWRTDRFSLRFCDPHPNYLWKLVVQFQESVTDTICKIIPGFYTPDQGHTHTHTNTHVYCVFISFICMHICLCIQTYILTWWLLYESDYFTVNFIFVYPLLKYISSYYTRDWISWLCSVLILNSSNYLTFLNKYFREKILNL